MTLTLALDAGTSSVRVLAFDHDGIIVAQAQKEIQSATDTLGRIVQDPAEILSSLFHCLDTVLKANDQPISAVGLTNQRESFVCLDYRTLDPLGPLISWQDRSTAARCRTLKEGDAESFVKERTGLPIDPYFSSTKLCDEVKRLNIDEAGRQLAFATVDTLITLALTSKTRYITEASNASRTQLFNTETLSFSDELLDLFELDSKFLRFPEVVPSIGGGTVLHSETFPMLNGVPLGAILGDQQSSLLGQGCLTPGSAKNTYGTGSFLLANTASNRLTPSNGLLGSVGWTLPDGVTTYVLEGAIYSTGSTLRWFRDALGLFDDYSELDDLIAATPSSGGTTFLPLFEGLGSPYMDPNPRGAITGLSLSSTRPEIVVGAIEAMAHQGADVIDAMEELQGLRIGELRVDGGVSVMNRLCQLQADYANVQVQRSTIAESTAFGVAGAAMYAVGALNSLDELRTINPPSDLFLPTKSRSSITTKRALWRDRLDRVRNAATSGERHEAY